MVLKIMIEVFVPNLGTQVATETDLKGKHGRGSTDKGSHSLLCFTTEA